MMTNQPAEPGFGRGLPPRRHFLGAPAVQAPTISPDGRLLAWLAPYSGVANIWVAPVDRPADARLLTREPRRSPGAPVFAYDGRHLLFAKDGDGDENSQLHAVDLDNGAVRALTARDGSKAMLMALSPERPDQILVRMNDRDPRFHDVHALDLATGDRCLVERNEAGYASYVADRQLRLRFARLSRPDGGAIIRRRDKGGDWVDLFQIEPEDANLTRLTHLDSSGRTLFMLDSRGRDTAALVALDTMTGDVRLLAENERADIDGMIVDEETGMPLASASGALRRAYRAIEPAILADVAALDSANLGVWSTVGMSSDMTIWLVVAHADTAPPAIHLYRRGSRRCERIFEIRPELADLPLGRTHALEIPSRDGLGLVSYLTLPPFADRTHENGCPRTDAPLALVVIVHGGPATRDRFGFDSEAQWLASRGYAVLKVNYRGSTGFGKSFLEAGNLQWGRAMSDDIDDAVDWVVARAIADPARVAITGDSYGGYAVLVALTRTPDRYTCGIDLVGPSNLETLIETIPPYWEPIRKAWLRSVGDPATPDGQRSLRERSPLHKAKHVRRPLLIGQGANDPRVKRSEADQMVAALKRNNVPVVYALFPDEGHGFGRPENALCFAALRELFLARCLGGAHEPLGTKERRASSLELVEGDLVEDLVS